MQGVRFALMLNFGRDFRKRKNTSLTECNFSIDSRPKNGKRGTLGTSLIYHDSHAHMI